MTHKTRLFLLFALLLMACSCTEEVIREVVKDPEVLPRPDNSGMIDIKHDGFNDDNYYEMFNDDEEDDILFNSATRKVKVNQPLQVSMQEDKTLLVRYYGARTIKDVTIWATITGYEHEFRFAHFEELPPFTEFKTMIPLAQETLEYTTIQGKVIEIPANPYITADDLSFRIDCNDPFYKKVTAIDWNVELTFGTYHHQGGNWIKMLPSHARESMALYVNVGYMISSPEFEEEIHKHKFYWGDGEETLIPNETVVTRARRKNGSLTLGATSGVNGLGGGNTLGVAEWQYFEHYVDDKSQRGTLFHEYAHCMGYGHSGNMTYNSYGDDVGFVKVCSDLFEKMSIEKRMPVYSRRFLHTRKTRKTYGQSKYQSSYYIIEDPELDALDGGLDEHLPQITDPSSGTPVSFILDFSNIPGMTQESFMPKDVAVVNNLVYVLNDATNNQSVELFRIDANKVVHVKSLKSWIKDEAEMTFAGAVKGIAADENFVYVNGVESRTDVFVAQTLHYYSSIGNGAWGGGNNQTVHAFETILRGNMIFLQDKQKINIYKSEDVTPQTIHNVPRIAQTIEMGNANDTFGFDIDNNGKAFVTYAPSKKIFVYDFSSFRMFTVLKPSAQLTLNTAVVDVVCDGSRLLGVQKNKPYLVELDKSTGAVVKDFSAAYEFGKLEKISLSRATLFGIDRNLNKVVAIPLSNLQ